MDDRQFDRFTQSLTERLSRRGLGRLGAGTITALGIALSVRHDATAKKKSKKKTKKKSNEKQREIRHEFVGKSYIDTIELEHPQNTQMQAMKTLFAVNDQAANAERIPDNSLGYRMRTAITTSTICKGNHLIRATITNQNFHMGFENLILWPSNPLNAGWVQGAATTEIARVTNDDTCATYVAEIHGVPNVAAIAGACLFVGYERQTITHTVRAKVCCNAKNSLTSITGTAFPSHRVFVDGISRQTIPQGPLERLMQIANPQWQPMSRASQLGWSQIPIAIKLVRCGVQCLDTENRSRDGVRAESDICPISDCPSEAICADGDCLPLGGCCLCDDGECRPSDECCDEEQKVTLPDEHYRCEHCREFDESCDSEIGRDCCDGLGCVDGSCKDCIPEGGSCSSESTISCCSRLSCDGGVCRCPHETVVCGGVDCPTGADCCINQVTPDGGCCSEAGFPLCCPNTRNNQGTIGACCPGCWECCDAYCCPPGTSCCESPDFCCPIGSAAADVPRRRRAPAPIPTQPPSPPAPVPIQEHARHGEMAPLVTRRDDTRKRPSQGRHDNTGRGKRRRARD